MRIYCDCFAASPQYGVCLVVPNKIRSHRSSNLWLSSLSNLTASPVHPSRLRWRTADNPDPTMKIELQMIGGEGASFLEVEGHATVADLKRAVCESQSCELGSFFLLLDGVELGSFADVTALSECGLEEGTTLTLVKKVVLKVLTASDDETAKMWDSSTGGLEQNWELKS